MKKYLYILILSALFISCGDKKEPVTEKPKEYSLTADTSDLKTTPFDDKSLKDIQLQYRLKKGDKNVYRLTSINQEEAIISAGQTMSQKILEKRGYIITTEIKDVEPDNTLEVAFTFESVSVDADVDGQKLNYQSGKKIDSLDRKKFSEFEALYQNNFSARISPNGDVVELFKIDKIISKMISLTGLKDSVNVEQKKMVQEQIEMTVLRPIVSQIFRKLSTDKVSLNSEWSFPQPTVDLQLFTLDNTYLFKLLSFEKLNDDVIAVMDAGLKTKVNINPEAKKNKIDVKQPKYSADGKVYFNATKNLIQKSITQIRFDIEVTAPMQTQTGQVILGSRIQKKLNKNITELLN